MQECLAKDPSNYARAICSMRKAVFAIQYHHIIQDTLVAQVKRIVDFLLASPPFTASDGMEDAVAAYTGPAKKHPTQPTLASKSRATSSGGCTSTPRPRA